MLSKAVILILIVSVFSTFPIGTYFKITNKNRSDWCFQRTGSVGKIKAIPCGSDSSFQWKIRTGQTNWYVIESKAGDGWDVNSGSIANGANIITYPINGAGGDNENFDFILINTIGGIEYFSIKIKKSQKCIWTNPDLTTDNVIQQDCPDFNDPLVADNVKDQYLYKFPSADLTVTGIISQSKFPTISLWGNSILTSINSNRIYQLTCTDSTGATCSGTVDSNAGTYTVTAEPSSDPNVDKTLQIRLTMAEYQTTTINVAVRTTSLTASDATKILITPVVYTYVIELSWNQLILDLDLYVLTPENELVFYDYKKSTNNIVNYVNPDLRLVDATKTEKIIISPNQNGMFSVYVKNYSKNGKLKDSGASIKITRADGTNTYQNTYAISTNDHNEFFNYWNVVNILTDYQTIIPVNTITNRPTPTQDK